MPSGVLRLVGDHMPVMRIVLFGPDPEPLPDPLPEPEPLPDPEPV